MKTECRNKRMVMLCEMSEEAVALLKKEKDKTEVLSLVEGGRSETEWVKTDHFSPFRIYRLIG